MSAAASARLPPRFIINGRFGGQRTTGVQRVAHALVAALDAEATLPGAWELWSPRGATWPVLRRIGLQQPPWPVGGGHLWEQLVLGMAPRSARVVNVAGSGPWLGGPQVSWLHDAAVFDHPEGYRPAFVAWYRALFRRRARRGDLLITPSRHAHDQLRRHLPLSPGQLAVLPNGSDHLDGVEADSAVLARLGLEPGRFWLCVASRNPNKNLARLVKAHAAARLPGLPLVLAGAGDARVFAGQSLAAGARVLSLAPTDPELKALFIAARALVMPSLSEGFGLPALEAQRLGCAVVAARAGALPEVCGDAAVYVDPLRVDDIAAALHLLASDDDRRLALQRDGRANAAAYTWARTAQGLLQLLARDGAT